VKSLKTGGVGGGTLRGPRGGVYHISKNGKKVSGPAPALSGPSPELSHVASQGGEHGKKAAAHLKKFEAIRHKPEKHADWHATAKKIVHDWL